MYPPSTPIHKASLGFRYQETIRIVGPIRMLGSLYGVVVSRPIDDEDEDMVDDIVVQVNSTIYSMCPDDIERVVYI